MKYCYQNFCITTSSILSGIILALIFMIVYSNDRIILIKHNDNKN